MSDSKPFVSTQSDRSALAFAVAAFAVGTLQLATAAAAGAPPAPPATIQHDKGSGLEVSFIPYPWRPDLFRGFEQGDPAARSWAFARLVVSSSFTLDGTSLEPGQYAVVLHPKTGAIPMTLELRRVGKAEFLVDPPAMAPPPAGATAYSRPVTFSSGAEPTPVLDMTIASWTGGSQLTIRYGDRKLAKDLPRSGP